MTSSAATQHAAVTFPIPRSDDEFGGNTSCVEIRSNKNEIIIFDMGTGLRDLGNSIIKNDSDITDINIVLSHFHYDHILGFLMFIPLFIDKYNVTYLNGREIPVSSLHEDLKVILGENAAGRRTVILKVHHEVTAIYFEPVIEAISEAGGELHHILEEDKHR